MKPNEDKFTRERKYSKEEKTPMTLCSIRIDDSVLLRIAEIHSVLSEWVRDAIDEKLEREERITRALTMQEPKK